jgi:transposase InsO family protein
MQMDASRSGGSEDPLLQPEKNESPESLPGGSGEHDAGARPVARDSRGRRRFTASERRELLAALESSGQTVTEFATARDMKATTLHTWLRKARQTGRRSKGARPRYTPEQRRAAIEAFGRSGRTIADFAALWGVSNPTLSSWLKRYAEEGPKGLQDRIKAGPGRPRKIPPAVREEIAEIKLRFPGFGMRKVRDWLRRFRGVRVSAGTVQKTLAERGLARTGPAPKRKPKKKPPRRFERARPMQLWQSDITSYMLTRQSVRVYLVVFLDDCSRYVVSWSLCTHQKTEMVQECLLDGIARFGKPEEVLTDQGPQYHSWRGKSAFDKLLTREGIHHVVARTHHPQTLGKCERLWKTVAEELWDRARPQDLTEARERLEHWFAHYNHFRTHQGIDGLLPADRFFGAGSAVRDELEARMGADELRAALEDEPRQSLYLFGQIGDRQVSLHGERGRVVVRTDEGELCDIAMDRMGVERNQTEKETSDERGNDGVKREHGVKHDEAETDACGAQAHALRELPAPGDRGARPVGAGDRGGEEPGAPDVHGDPGVLAGEGEQAGDRAAPRSAAASRVAAVPAGAERDAGGAVASAEEPQEDPARAGESGAGPRGPAQADRRAGAEARADRGPGAGAEGPAVGEDRGGDAEEGESCRNAETSRTEEGWGAGIPSGPDSKSGEG